MDAFWFSMQTMNAIGYGSMYPDGYYAHSLTFFQSWLGLLIIGGLTAIVFAKLSRPS
jgi:inward rectifier potassium channel